MYELHIRTTSTVKISVDVLQAELAHAYNLNVSVNKLLMATLNSPVVCSRNNEDPVPVTMLIEKLVRGHLSVSFELA